MDRELLESRFARMGARLKVQENAPRGRGTQMHAGAVAATGDILWFLHADTQPPEDAPRPHP